MACCWLRSADANSVLMLLSCPLVTAPQCQYPYKAVLLASARIATHATGAAGGYKHDQPMGLAATCYTGFTLPGQ
jgi:hypothetical protein